MHFIVKKTLRYQNNQWIKFHNTIDSVLTARSMCKKLHTSDCVFLVLLKAVTNFAPHPQSFQGYEWSIRINLNMNY